MKKFLLTSFLLICCLCVSRADNPEKFSPEEFLAEMERFITQEAKLTEDEAQKLFPLSREMHAKQRVVYEKIKRECKQKPSDEAECRRVVQLRDKYELELKTIQQTYHNKFFSILPPSKVYDVIKAEDRFHRRAFKNWGSHNRKPSRH